MKKSKTILLSKLIVFLFLITLINTAYCVHKEPFSYYSENTKVISGEVTEITKIDDGYKLILKAKEKIIVYYYDKLKINTALSSCLYFKESERRTKSNR